MRGSFPYTLGDNVLTGENKRIKAIGMNPKEITKYGLIQNGRKLNKPKKVKK